MAPFRRAIWHSAGRVGGDTPPEVPNSVVRPVPDNLANHNPGVADLVGVGGARPASVCPWCRRCVAGRGRSPRRRCRGDLDEITAPQVLRVLVLAFEEQLPFGAAGRRELMIWAGFGGALSAVPTGVPVSSRSPGSRRWNRLRACSASNGG